MDTFVFGKRRAHKRHSPAGAHVRNESLSEVHRDWLIHLACRSVGMTIRHSRYSVIIRLTEPAYEEYLTGFRSKAEALSAARRRIDFLQDVSRPMFRRRKRTANKR